MLQQKAPAAGSPKLPRAAVRPSRRSAGTARIALAQRRGRVTCYYSISLRAQAARLQKQQVASTSKHTVAYDRNDAAASDDDDTTVLSRCPLAGRRLYSKIFRHIKYYGIYIKY